MMFRTVWLAKLVLPAIGLAAQEATQPPRNGCAGFCAAPADAAAGTAAAAPRTRAAPPRTAASRLPRGLADGKSFTSLLLWLRCRKFRDSSIEITDAAITPTPAAAARDASMPAATTSFGEAKTANKAMARIGDKYQKPVPSDQSVPS